MIVGLFPDLLSVGGIQTAGRQTAAVLATIACERGSEYRFFGLNDPRGQESLRCGDSSFVFRGFGADKLRFSVAALRLAFSKPTIVVAAHPHLAVPAAAMKVMWPKLRMVVMTHGIEVWTPLSALRRRSIQRADLVLAPSTDTARKLAAVQDISEGKISCLPWALDPDFAELSGNLDNGTPPEGFPRDRVILTVGRWATNERYKGLDHLIECMPALLRSFPSLYLVAVGEGDDRSRLEELAVRRGVNMRVRFLNHLSKKDLVTCNSLSEVFALPSGGEGFGLVFLEAMALGKPVVAGAQGGACDIVEDNMTGFLVPYGDVERLTRALETLLADVGLRKQMGERGRARICNNYLFEQFQSRLRSIISKQCDG